MPETPAQRALGASTAALIVAFVAFALLLPPLASGPSESVLRTILVALALAAGLLLHWIFLAIGARRLGRSAAGWVTLSVVLCPLGSIVALVLLAWLRAETDAAPAA
jgi:hypothetical protein